MRHEFPNFDPISTSLNDLKNDYEKYLFLKLKNVIETCSNLFTYNYLNNMGDICMTWKKMADCLQQILSYLKCIGSDKSILRCHKLLNSIYSWSDIKNTRLPSTGIFELEKKEMLNHNFYNMYTWGPRLVPIHLVRSPV